MAEIMSDKKVSDPLNEVPLSDITLFRQINEMSVKVIEKVMDTIKPAGQFAFIAG